MRGGGSASRTAFYYNGYEYGGHRHHDTLGISYLALGREFVSDRGYIWDDPRNAWTKSTLSHNIVTVDGGNQNGENRLSRLELFGVSPFVEVTRASADAYSQCDRYERTCVLVRLPDGGTYAVDLFRVRGGKLHQYCLNCNGGLIGLTGADPQPVDLEIKWLSNLRTASPKGTFSATWEHEGARLDMIMLNPVDRLIVADATGWRNNRGEAINAPPIQQVIAERTGEPAAKSDFAVVLAPYEGKESPVKSVRSVYYDSEGGTVAIAIDLGYRTDYILISCDEKRREYGPVVMSGRFGFASVDGRGDLVRAYLLNGTELTCKGKGVRLDTSNIPLRVASTEGRTYRLAESIPADMHLDGKYALTGGTGFEIASHSGNSITVRDYPAIASDIITVLNSGVYEKK